MNKTKEEEPKVSLQKRKKLGK